ncbi:MAG: hypothetical protein WAM72_22940 [Xanthobacteraceae bacterium]
MKVLFMGRPFIRAHFTFCIAGAICAFWLTSACCQEAAKQPKLNSEMERCRRINNEHMRTHCLEQINSKAAPVPQQQPTASGTWQLTRTPNPLGGPDSISISKIANPTPSEQDVAGLMLRCAEGATTDVLIVLTAPLPPRTHPKVTVVAGATTTEFIATVMPPGALVLLPEKASALIENSWQSVPELTVSISDNNRALRGVIPLEDISNAVQELQSNCPKVVRGRK